MTFDDAQAAEYRKRVLTPYKGPRLGELQSALRELKSDASLSVPRKLDLAGLYDMTSDMGDTALAAQVVSVSDVFSKSTNNAAVKSIAASLNELHTLLKNRNQDFFQATFWRAQLAERDQRSKGKLVEFAGDAASELQTLGVVTPAKLRQLARGAHLADSISDQDLATAIEKAGIKVMPEIVPPTISVPPGVMSDLVKTSCSSLVEAIFLDGPPARFSVIDGFRADNGAALTLQRVREARDLTDLRQSNENDWIKKVLGAILGAIKTDAELHGMLLAHFIDQGRMAAQGDTLQVMALKNLTETGLDRLDAARILMQFAGASKTAGFPDVQAKVAAGSLREARRLFDALRSQSAGSRSDSMEKAQSALEASEARLELLRQTAQIAVEAGDITGAAKALNDALTLCADDEVLEEMARALPPAAPLNLVLTTAQNGRAVVVTWSPGFGATADIEYRIVRKTAVAPKNAHDGEVVAEKLTRNLWEDPGPPLASQVFYAVAASRGGGFSPVVVDSITLAPPVADVTATSDLTSVSLRWNTPPGARSVSITQAAPDGSVTDVPVNAHSGATASGLVTGATYTFVLTASYNTVTGAVMKSEPVRLDAVPRGTARPVPSLSVRQAGGRVGRTEVEATWQELSGFAVEVWSFVQPQSWPYGTRVAMSQIARDGQRLTGAAIGGGRRQGVRGAVEAGLRYYLAVTRDGSEGVVGQQQELGISPALFGLSAERFNDWVVLSWEWPGEDFDVRVRWTGRAGSGESVINHVRYSQQGGLRIQAGTAGSHFVLTTEPANSSQQWASPECTLDVPAAETALSYTVEWHRRPFRAPEVVLTFTADGPLGPTRVVVVGKEGAVMPFAKTDGIPVDQRDLDFQQHREQTITVTLPKLGKHYWVRAFAAASQPVRLVDPPSNDLRGA